jgi:hypothetical protein
MNDERRPATSAAATILDPSATEGTSRAGRKPAASELLQTPGALLSRGHLRELGLERRAIDAVFRELGVVVLPGYRRPLVRAHEYLELLDRHTYAKNRVRPS